MALEFIGIKESEFIKKYKFIYRFITIERLLESLNTTTIIFKNPEKWEDPYESYFLSATYARESLIYKWPLQKRLFCLCFSKTASSEAFWKGYTPLNDGVRVKFDTAELVRSFKKDERKFYVGEVNYKLTDDIKEFKKNTTFIKKQLFSKNIKNNIELLLLKRISFKYEEEVRFVIVIDEPSEDETLLIKIDPKIIFNEFMLHPKMGILHAKILKNYLNREYNAKHSQLYTPRKVKINF